jgi:hypothetical protein
MKNRQNAEFMCLQPLIQDQLDTAQILLSSLAKGKTYIYGEHWAPDMVWNFRFHLLAASYHWKPTL